jgi:hypothetical protein
MSRVLLKVRDTLLLSRRETREATEKKSVEMAVCVIVEPHFFALRWQL